MTATVPDIEVPYCLERLEKKVDQINGGDISDKTYRSLVVQLSSCFVVVGRGWVRAEGIMRDLQNRIPPAEEPKEEKDSDTFKTILLWVKDKILPDLIKLILLGAIAWVLEVNEVIQLIPPPATP